MFDQGRAIAALLCFGCAAAALPAVPAHAQAAVDELPMLAEWKSADGTGMATALAVSRDGRYVLSGYYQRSILWDAQSGRPLAVLRGHHSDVAVAFLDGQRAVTADAKKGLIVWDIPTGRRAASWTSKNGERLAVAPDGRRIAGASFDEKTVVTWDAPAGRQAWRRDGLTGWPTGLTYSSDGKLVVTGERGSVGLWNAATGSPIGKIGMNAQVWAVAVSPDNRVVAAAEPAAIRIADIESKRVTASIKFDDDTWFQDVTFTPNGRHVATADTKGQTLIAALATGQFVAISPDSPVKSQRLAISPDGSRAYVGRSNGTIQVLDLSALR